nr:hypothetical protein [Candidatus Sigynarchaeota archaeon]
MKESVKQFFPFIVAVCGQSFLFVLLLFTRPNEFVAEIDSGIIWLRTISLIAGCVMLSFILVKFSFKYHRNPSMVRLNVLLALISYMIATVAYLISTSFQFPSLTPERMVDRVFTDTTNIFMMVGTVLFLILGITFFLAPSNERSIRIFKHVLNIFIVVIYVIFITSKTLRILNVATDTADTLDSLSEILLYCLGGFGIVMLLVIAVRALVISKKTTDEKYKHGLKALGLSYLFLFAAVLTL